MTYKGFEIDDGRIYFGGKQIFTARWQYCHTVEEAKELIDASIEQKERTRQAFSKLPSYSHFGSCELENGQQERDRLADKIDGYFEKQLEP